MSIFGKNWVDEEPTEVNQEIAFIKKKEELRKLDRYRLMQMLKDTPVTYKESE